MKLEMKSIIYKELIPYDKLLHFVAGLLIALFASVFTKWVIIPAVLIGLAKEIRDQIVYKGFDYEDLIATILGGQVVQIIVLITYL